MIGLIQIPSTSEAVDAKGVYTLFNIHVNGCYHGSFRYSQLLLFHQELKAKFSSSTNSFEEFPSKHWFGSLSPEQLLARRIGLERYLHSVCQDRTVGTSDLLKEFLIAIQKASDGCADISADVEVFLVNSKSVTVTVGTYDRTDQVLERVCAEIKLASELTYFFGLFLEKQEEDGTWTVDRPLTEFECPYVSLASVNKLQLHRITIRKNFWDPIFLPDLCADRVAKNLLYIETLASVISGHWEVGPDLRKQLTTTQRKGQKKEYIDLASTVPQYGFSQLSGLTIDHPEGDTPIFMRVGKMEMTSFANIDGEVDTKLFTYPLTRIKSWKLGGKPGSPWLKFFFQEGPGDFVPVGVVGTQAIFLSNCLHSIVDELLRVRGKQEIRQPQAIVRDLRDLPKVVFYESPEAMPLTDEDDMVDSTDPPLDLSTSTDTPPMPTTSSAASKPHTPGPEASNITSSSADHQSRLSSVTSTGEPEQAKVKTPKKKMATSSDVENPTFEFGTDDDL